MGISIVVLAAVLNTALLQILRVVPYSATQLYSYEVLKKRFQNEKGELSLSARLAAGGLAGMTATLVPPRTSALLHGSDHAPSACTLRHVLSICSACSLPHLSMKCLYALDSHALPYKQKQNHKQVTDR